MGGPCDKYAEAGGYQYEAGLRMGARMVRAVPRIYTRCPACHNTTLTINDGRLLCTWHECPDPTMIDRIGEPNVTEHRQGALQGGSNE